MPLHCVPIFVFIGLHSLMQGAHSLQYSDLEALGIHCPKEHICESHKNDSTFLERGCECDSACSAYGDCCIGAGRQRYRTAESRRTRYRPSIQASTGVECHGFRWDAGVYAVSKCNRNWNGNNKVKRNCEGPPDFSNPFTAAPVTSVFRGVTYKNFHCAECNNADFRTLRTFLPRLFCKGLNNTSEEEIFDQLSYNREKNAWGVNRTDAEGNSNFKACKIVFDVPRGLQQSVRFCRANVISKCAPDWKDAEVAKLCEEYMSIVCYNDDDTYRAYRNPHCAICNNMVLSELDCMIAEKHIIHFRRLFDLNREKITTCPSTHKYDPFSKRCRKLRCALPGYVLHNGKCVRGG